MGFIQKKDESDDKFGDFDIITRGEGPDGVNDNPIELVKGESAEDIAAGTTAAEREAQAEADMIASAADEALMPEAEEAVDSAEEAADAAEDAVEDAAEGAADAAEDAADAAEEAAESVEDSVEDAAENAEDAAEEAEGAVDDAAEAAEDAVDEAADSVDDAADEATEAVEDAADEAIESTEDAAEEASEETAEEAPEKETYENIGDFINKKKPLAIAAAVAVVLIAAIVGYAIGHGGFGSKGLSSSTLTEDQLGTVVASYSYNGSSYDITAQEVLEAQYSLDTLKNDDDTYDAPDADSVLSYARNMVLLKAAEAQGIAASDDDITAYAEERIGTSDFSEMAESYNVSEDQAKKIVEQNYLLSSLYTQVVGDTDSTSATMPDAPTEPEDGNEDTASKEYADYIINLAGDNWDSEAGTWADSDSDWAQAFDGEEFTADSATYAQAYLAYIQAYTDYSNATSEATATWTEYENGLFANSNISIYGLFI